MKKQYRYNIYRPSGNDTALVEAKVTNLMIRKKINQLILKENPSVEQVGFVYWQKNPGSNETKQAKFSMAGYEFSGNGLRAACVYYLDNQPGKIQIQIEKIAQTTCLIDQNFNVKVEIPIYQNFDCVKKFQGYYLVEMPGTKNIIIEVKKFLGKKVALKQAEQVIDQLELWNEAGLAILFVSKQESIYSLEPVYWIGQMQTLTYETACGSGSTALGLKDAYLSKKPVSRKIIQPSQQLIQVNILVQDNQFQKATIAGSVQKLKQGIIKI